MADIDTIARVCHEASRALSVAQADPTVPAPDGWDGQLDDGMKESVRIGVRGILDGNTPEESHILWCQTRREQGWVWGEVKDPVRKTHPNLVLYAELPPEQRVKDDLFSAIVKALA